MFNYLSQFPQLGLSKIWIWILIILVFECVYEDSWKVIVRRSYFILPSQLVGAAELMMHLAARRILSSTREKSSFRTVFGLLCTRGLPRDGHNIVMVMIEYCHIIFSRLPDFIGCTRERGRVGGTDTAVYLIAMTTIIITRIIHAPSRVKKRCAKRTFVLLRQWGREGEGGRCGRVRWEPCTRIIYSGVQNPCCSRVTAINHAVSSPKRFV